MNINLHNHTKAENPARNMSSGHMHTNETECASSTTLSRVISHGNPVRLLPKRRIANSLSFANACSCMDAKLFSESV